MVAKRNAGKSVSPDELKSLLQKLPVMFDEAQREVYLLMSRDSFATFRKSAMFKEMLQDIGVYSDQEINGSSAILRNDNDAPRFWRTASNKESNDGTDLENVESVYSRLKLKEG